MSSKHELSLLPKEEFEQRTLGRLLIWALSVGRWIVVFTEFIVICAFLSRFYLDRRIADLHEDIFQKQAIVQAMNNFEEEFRFLKERVEIIESLAGQPPADEVLEAVISLVPVDVALTNFTFENGEVEITAIALSQQGLADFWHQINDTEIFTNARITEVSKKEDRLGISFKVVANFIGLSNKKKENAITS